MKKQIEYKVVVPRYNTKIGFEFAWYGDSTVHFDIEKDIAIIKADRDGLISLASHLLNMAQDDIPAGYHIHLDDLGSFEDGSDELIIEKF
jgi:hypothetical protein